MKKGAVEILTKMAGLQRNSIDALPDQPSAVFEGFPLDTHRLVAVFAVGQEAAQLVEEASTELRRATCGVLELVAEEAGAGWLARKAAAAGGQQPAFALWLGVRRDFYEAALTPLGTCPTLSEVLRSLSPAPGGGACLAQLAELDPFERAEKKRALAADETGRLVACQIRGNPEPLLPNQVLKFQVTWRKSGERRSRHARGSSPHPCYDGSSEWRKATVKVGPSNSGNSLFNSALLTVADWRQEVDEEGWVRGLVRTLKVVTADSEPCSLGEDTRFGLCALGEAEAMRAAGVRLVRQASSPAGPRSQTSENFAAALRSFLNGDS